MKAYLQTALEQLLHFIAGLDPLWAPPIFILCCAVATTMLVPTSMLVLAAGFTFGMVWGGIYGLIGITLGAALSFLISRHLAFGWVHRKSQNHPKFIALDKAIAAEGFKIVALLRFCPLFPHALLNYTFGVMRVTFRDFLGGTILGSIPMIIFFSVIGGSLKSIAEITASERTRTPAEWAFIALTLIVTIAILYYLARFARKALSQAEK